MVKYRKKSNALRRNMIYLYAIGDYISAIVAWLIFWFYRQSVFHYINPEIYDVNRAFYYRDYLLAFIAVPCIWFVLYLLSGSYFDLYKKSRLHESYRTIFITILGCLFIGMIAFANDTDSFLYFFKITSWYFLAHISFTLFTRLILLQISKKHIASGRIKYHTLIVGTNGQIVKLYNDIKKHISKDGTDLIGYINIENKALEERELPINFLGNIAHLETLIDKYEIDTVLLAIPSNAHNLLEEIMIRLSYSGVAVKAMPDLYDLISGSVRMNNILAPLLITINPELLPDWQKVCKRALDIIASSIAIIILSPLYAFAAIKVKLSSPGPILYKQERIGLHGKPFHIYKFRSMFIDAEKNGPLLSSDFDPRITKWGKIMRKWRIDEIPQFFNILWGDMSLVGPRPERKYFIDAIIKTHPHYKLLHQVKPGLSSWGMVQYGYAENVEQMTERMRYDLLYIENCSLLMDVKIMIYTIKVILQGRGK